MADVPVSSHGRGWNLAGTYMDSQNAAGSIKIFVDESNGRFKLTINPTLGAPGGARGPFNVELLPEDVAPCVISITVPDRAQHGKNPVMRAKVQIGLNMQRIVLEEASYYQTNTQWYRGLSPMEQQQWAAYRADAVQPPNAQRPRVGS